MCDVYCEKMEENAAYKLQENTATSKHKNTEHKHSTCLKPMRPKMSLMCELVALGQPMLALGRRPSGRLLAAVGAAESLRPAFQGITGPPMDSIATAVHVR